MQRSICRAAPHAAMAVLMAVFPCGNSAAQEYAGREKLRAQSNEFRKDVIKVTDGVYVAVGYSASNVMDPELRITACLSRPFNCTPSRLPLSARSLVR